MAPLIWGLCDLGFYDEALALAQKAMSLAQQHGLQMLFFPINFAMGAIYRAMQAYEEALATHLAAWPLVEGVGMPTLIEVLASELCADCALMGNWEAAQQYAFKSLENRSDIILMVSKRTLWYVTEALVRAGKLEEATEDVQHYGKLIGNNRRYRVPYLRSLAVLSEFHGKMNKAIEYLQEAATLAEEIGLPGELWLLKASLGELYLKQVEKQQAYQAFEQATAIVQRLAENISDDGQRVSFLAAPVVRQLVNQRELLE